MTNVSLFAYVADGRNGLRVVQLTSPEDTPGHYGFSPKPTPRLIATHHTRGEALAVSEGLDRDRAADESGNQLSVFGRRGARPFNLGEMQRMYLKAVGGKPGLYSVPEIRDPSRKRNRDVRDFYGPPAKADGAARAEEPEGGQGKPEGKPEGAAPPERSHDRSAGLFNLLFIFLPAGIGLIQWRRQRRG